jgi:hypothetical protein
MTLDRVSGKEPVRAMNDDQRIMTGTLDMIRSLRYEQPGCRPSSATGGILASTKAAQADSRLDGGSLPERLPGPPAVLRSTEALRAGFPATLELSRNGATAGAIYIPKIYNSRTDFLVLRIPATPRESVRDPHQRGPDPEMPNGDFSFSVASTTTPIRLGKWAAWTRQPFQTTKFPYLGFDPVAKNLRSQPWVCEQTRCHYSGHAEPGIADEECLLFQPLRYESGSPVSSAHRIFGRWSWMRNRAPGSTPPR